MKKRPLMVNSAFLMVNIIGFPLFHRQLISARNPRYTLQKPILHISSSWRISTLILPSQKSNFKNFTAISPTAPSTEESPPPDQEIESEREEKFEWYEQWYPVCDLDKSRPHAKKVIGIDLVVWWDRNENSWKVFEDSCPHRLAPLSEGRINQWGRLQCVYHGWCFGDAGDCKFIPQAPRDGPPADREGGRPLEISVQKVDVDGFAAKQIYGENYFIVPCLFYGHYSPSGNDQSSNKVGLPPVPTERKLRDVGPLNWHKACYVPTKADALPAAFRRWLNKYGGTQVDWRNKYSGELPPTPPREQPFDRYWTHTVNCSSCSVAYKRLNVLKIALQVISVASVAAAAAAKQGAISIAARYSVASMAVLCFVASKWLSHFHLQNFHIP